MKTHILAAALLLWVCPPALADPALRETELYAQTVRACHPVDLNGWAHPTRAVLLHNKVELLGVDLCNGDTYPVFKVRFPYDPNGPTSSFFKPLLADMTVANAYWPFAFVDAATETVINLNDGRQYWNVKMSMKRGKRDVAIYVNYEQYDSAK